MSKAIFLFFLTLTIYAYGIGHLYKRMAFPATFWHDYVFHESQASKSLVECGSLCSMLDECEAFKYVGPQTCWLTNFQNQSSIIEVQEGSTLHVKICKYCSSFSFI